MPSTVTVVVSDALIIKACNTPTGSGGVARYANKLANEMKLAAEMLAPIGDELDAGSRNEVVGTYLDSFGIARGDRGNQHKVIRYIYNDAPHARYVEFGRGPSSGSRGPERFTWSAIGGRWMRAAVTRGWEGHHVLEKALATVVRANRL
jgi:hypothetical protein